MSAETIQWVAPDGPTIQFYGDTGYAISDGAGGGSDGRFAPTFKHITEQLPNDGGTRLRNLVAQPRTITVPLEITGADAVETRERWRALVNACDPRKGDGLLQFTPPDGIPREFRCRYMQGLEGVDSLSHSDPGLTSWLVAPQFVAYDSFAQDAADTTQVWTTASGGGTFFPIFPIVLGSSEVFADTALDIFGDDDAWPVWSIAGPGSQLVIADYASTPNRFLRWGGTLGAGETLTIDTRPSSMLSNAAIPRVRDADGLNRFTELTAWDFWPLTPGSRRVHIEFSGATSVSQVSVVYRQRWATT